MDKKNQGSDKSSKSKMSDNSGSRHSSKNQQDASKGNSKTTWEETNEDESAEKGKSSQGSKSKM